jgi:hypothetical protein
MPDSQALVAHACNPSYLEGGDKKDHGWRLVKFARSHFNQQLGMMVHSCHPSCAGKHKERDPGPGAWVTSKNLSPK